MNSRLVHGAIISLIALAIVPFGMNAIGAHRSPPIDPGLFRLFLATSLLAWSSLVLFSVYLAVTRHELTRFAWMTVAGVLGSYFLINLFRATLA